MAGPIQEASSAGGIRRLYPVVLRVPAHLGHLRGRAQVAVLSRLARMAVRFSARLTGVAPPAFAKDERGAPRPHEGIHWSVTHKPAFVAGVVAPAPIGIDIEHIRRPSDGLIRRIASAEEWQLGRDMARSGLFYRYWTAKEAVLKAEGVGLRGLARCRVTAIRDRQEMQLVYDRGARDRRSWSVRHHYLSAHVVALTRRDEDIQWRVAPPWPQRC